MVYVYILFSESIKQYYCGQTTDLPHRLNRHNAGETLSNKHSIPWILIGYLVKNSRSEAMILERQIKKRGIKRWLQDHEERLNKNI